MNRATRFAIFCVCLIGVACLPAAIFVLGLPEPLAAVATLVFGITGVRTANGLHR